MERAWTRALVVSEGCSTPTPTPLRRAPRTRAEESPKRVRGTVRNCSAIAPTTPGALVAPCCPFLKRCGPCFDTCPRAPEVGNCCTFAQNVNNGPNTIRNAFRAGIAATWKNARPVARGGLFFQIRTLGSGPKKRQKRSQNRPKLLRQSPQLLSEHLLHLFAPCLKVVWTMFSCVVRGPLKLTPFALMAKMSKRDPTIFKKRPKRFKKGPKVLREWPARLAKQICTVLGTLLGPPRTMCRAFCLGRGDSNPKRVSDRLRPCSGDPIFDDSGKCNSRSFGERNDGACRLRSRCPFPSSPSLDRCATRQTISEARGLHSPLYGACASGGLASAGASLEDKGAREKGPEIGARSSNLANIGAMGVMFREQADFPKIGLLAKFRACGTDFHPSPTLEGLFPQLVFC